jgi:hypothetical protein
MKNKRLVFILLGAGSLLLIPFIAMQFTHEVDWNGFDFLIMGALLMVTGSFGELVLRWQERAENRVLVGGVVLLTFFLLWAELAVGIFGSPFAGA